MSGTKTRRLIIKKISANDAVFPIDLAQFRPGPQKNTGTGDTIVLDKAKSAVISVKHSTI